MTNNCPSCNGNDKDMPCAYPSEGKAGCLRDKRMTDNQKPSTKEQLKRAEARNARRKIVLRRTLRELADSNHYQGIIMKLLAGKSRKIESLTTRIAELEGALEEVLASGLLNGSYIIHDKMRAVVREALQPARTKS